MAQTTTLNGVSYSIPDPGDTGWGAGLTAFFVAIAPGVLQKTGGTFTLTAPLNFGASFGVTALSMAISGATANTVPYLDGTKTFISSAVTPTELGYISGVTSALQAQINAKAPIASPTFTGVVTIPTPFTLGATSVTATGTELNYSVGVTSAIQTQIDTKAPTASPTFTGTVTIPSPFTLGATSVTTTGAELNFVAGVTSAIQTQLNTKATDSLVVHLAGTETITGTKSLTAALLGFFGTEALPGYAFDGDPDTGMVRIAANRVGLSVNGAVGIQVRTTDVEISNPLIAKGTDTNNSAPSGFIGEYIESVVGTTAYPTSGNFGDVTSISLTAGDWDVSLIENATANGATVSTMQAGISTTSGNSTTGLVVGSNQTQSNGPINGVTGDHCVVPVYRMSLSATTTVYAKFSATYAVATPNISGARLSARRVR